MRKDEERQYLDDTGTPYVSYKLDDTGNLLEGERVDGDWDITLDLTENEIKILEAAADTVGVSIDEYIIDAIKVEMDKSEPFAGY